MMMALTALLLAAVVVVAERRRNNGFRRMTDRADKVERGGQGGDMADVVDQGCAAIYDFEKTRIRRPVNRSVTETRSVISRSRSPLDIDAQKYDTRDLRLSQRHFERSQCVDR